MDLVTVILLAIALCFDSFAVSVSSGMTCSGKWFCFRGIRFAFVLGFMQGAMTLIGWFLSWNFRSLIEQWDHWIAFSLLLFLGIKMIYSALKGGKEESKLDSFAFSRSLVMGIATSIDAIIAGVTMAFLTITIVNPEKQLTNIMLSSGIIALVTLIASMTGLFVGKITQSKLGSKAEIIGGVVLILIGIKVLIEHLS